MAGLFKSLGDQISPEILQGVEIENAFKKLRKLAAIKGFNTPRLSTAAIFSQPTATIINSNAVIDIIISIPISIQSQALDLFRLESFPFQLFSNSIKNYAIIPSTNLIAANQERTTILEITNEELAQCRSITKVFFCPNIIRRKTSTTHSCVVNLFQAKFEAIRQTCDVSIIPAKEQVIRVNHFSTYFYTFGGKLFWKYSTTNPSGLPVEKHASVTLAPGLWHIQAPKQSDCTITTPTFTYRSFSPLEVVSQFETLSIDTDFRSLLNLSAGEIDLGIKLIEEHGNKNAIKLHEIKAAIDKAKAETWQYSSFQGTGIGLGFTAPLAIATLAVLCIAYFCLRKKAKTTIHQILNVPPPSAQDWKKGVFMHNRAFPKKNLKPEFFRFFGKFPLNFEFYNEISKIILNFGKFSLEFRKLTSNFGI